MIVYLFKFNMFNLKYRLTNQSVFFIITLFSTQPFLGVIKMSFSSKVVSSLEKCFLTSDINEFTELTEEKIFRKLQ